MRHLQIHRERALACFAISYFCFCDQDPAIFASPMTKDHFDSLVKEKSGLGFRNGESKTVEIDDQAHTLFAAAWRESGCLITNLSPIPEGSDPVSKVIITDYDGAKRLSLCMENLS